MPDLKMLAELGAFGVIMALLWMQWDERRRIMRVIGNHLEHETESRDANTAALQKLTDAIASLKEHIL